MPAFLRVLFLLVATCALFGCASTPAPRLDGTAWRLVAWSLSSQRPTDHDITARFADGGIAGRSAVNTYRAAVTAGPGDAIAIGPAAVTRMAGPEPAMRAESAYLALLAGARSYRLDGDTLTLRDAGGNDTLVFARAGD